MDFFNLNSSNFDELIFDMDKLKTAVENKTKSYTNSLKSIDNKGYYDIDSVRKGSVYYTESTIKFEQDTTIRSTEGPNNISLFFVKNGGVYSVNEKRKEELHLPSNSHNVFFMHEEYKKLSVLKKGVKLDTSSIHLTLEYFENLVNLYPDLFEKSFKRFEKGESFYLNNNFGMISAEMNHILAQIENANLIGSCMEPYIDSKVLELLCLQFQENLSPQFIQTIKDEDKIREASFILISDIHNPPSIRELALIVGINEKKLKQGFKSVFKTTVYGYLFDYKMTLAEQLLRDSQKSTSEIALQCGYEYSSHFCTAFKRKFGFSPLEMRKNTLITY